MKNPFKKKVNPDGITHLKVDCEFVKEVKKPSGRTYNLVIENAEEVYYQTDISQVRKDGFYVRADYLEKRSLKN